MENNEPAGRTRNQPGGQGSTKQGMEPCQGGLVFWEMETKQFSCFAVISTSLAIKSIYRKVREK
jgi:hypothetical protein